jgi:hypothetical protein
MPTFPDYGLYQLGSGYSTELRQFFYGFPLDHITETGAGQFTTMQNRLSEGVEYAMSLDFGSQILADILSLSPRAIADFLAGELSQVASLPRNIEFPRAVSMDFEAKLGRLQKGLHEEFVPFVITRVLRIQDPMPPNPK